jgi:hypothetical protein
LRITTDLLLFCHSPIIGFTAVELAVTAATPTGPRADFSGDALGAARALTVLAAAAISMMLANPRIVGARSRP